MSNFEKITATPEALGAFLASLPVATGPWEAEFHKMFCAVCGQTDCGDCQHEKERNNPLWWLTGTTEDKWEVPLDKLPEPLWEIKQNHPAVKIYETSPVSHGLKGNLHYMEVGAAMMFELGKLLWSGERKYRVIIECDPEIGKFEAKREDLAAGWKCVGQAGGLRWTGKRHPEVDLYPAQMKIRFEKEAD